MTAYVLGRKFSFSILIQAGKRVLVLYVGRDEFRPPMLVIVHDSDSANGDEELDRC
jgi:hypothetical protein